jgi:hypothetical protein
MPVIFLEIAGGGAAGQCAVLGVGRLLPPAARHNTAGLELGVLVDFWFCLRVMGLIELWFRHKEKVHGRK